MNEQQFAQQVILALAPSADRLPYRITHRLELARNAALSRIPERSAETAPQAALAGGSVSLLDETDRRWSPWLASVLSVLLLAGGLIAISMWSDSETAEETADVDLAVLTDDDVPLSAYADRGFGVFLKNSRQ